MQARVPYPLHVAMQRRGLLPRVFTLTFRRLFSVTGTLKITPHCAFHRRVPCPVRTFLGFPRQIVLPLFWTAKLAFIGEKSKRILNLGVFIPPGEPELYELETELGVPFKGFGL